MREWFFYRKTYGRAGPNLKPAELRRCKADRRNRNAPKLLWLKSKPDLVGIVALSRADRMSKRLHVSGPGPVSQPTADAGLVARILVVEVALEKPFFSRDHNHRNEADSWNERCEQPKVIQPN